MWASISERAASISRPYSTPEGQAVSQARHAKHRLMCSRYASVIGSPFATCTIW